MDYPKANFILFLVYLAIAISVKIFFDLTFFHSSLIVFIGLPLVGYLVTFDDDLEGGWSNPDGTRKHDFLTREYWGETAARFSVVFLGSCIDLGAFTIAAMSAWLAAAASVFFAVFLLSTRIRYLWLVVGLSLVLAAIYSWKP